MITDIIIASTPRLALGLPDLASFRYLRATVLISWDGQVLMTGDLTRLASATKMTRVLIRSEVRTEPLPPISTSITLLTRRSTSDGAASSTPSGIAILSAADSFQELAVAISVV